MPEEKRTDVNIAVYMLDDAYQGRCDRIVLVSGDSDLVPAIRMVRARFPSIKTTVYVPAQAPQRAHAVELRTAAHASRELPLNLLSKAQFPTGVLAVWAAPSRSRVLGRRLLLAKESQGADAFPLTGF